MSRTVHVCSGCGAEIASKCDLDEEIGSVYSTWRCRYCGTRIPTIVAEKIKHQRQH